MNKSIIIIAILFFNLFAQDSQSTEAMESYFKDGTIKSIEINDNSIGRSASETLRKLQAARFVASHGDQVCPASWKPGDETLKPGEDLVGKI